MTLTHLEKYGTELYKLGYTIVPIPAGSKGCFLDRWQTVDANEQMILGWTAAFAGCGIRGPGTVGVDIDCRDAALAQHMRNFVYQMLGYVPHRIGLPPKVLLPYRCEESFSKIRSKEFYSADGQKHQLEILANGCQFVASHIHPDTCNPYLWHYSDNSVLETLIVPRQELPAITKRDAEAIIAEFEKQCVARNWTPPRASQPKRYPPASFKRRHRYTDKDVLSMLSRLNPSMPYDQWLKVGMALHDGGFPMEFWDIWSKGATEKYKAGECQKKWDSFSTGDRP